MTRKEALKALLAEVEAGAASDKLGPIMMGHLNGAKQIYAMRAYNGSLDAAKALHEALLPGWDCRLFLSGVAWLYMPAKGAPPIRDVTGADNDVPARAWLIAIIKALISECDRTP